MKLEVSNPASKGCKGLGGIYWDLASYGSVPALIGRITEELVRAPPAHLLPESLSTPVVERALTSLIVEATGGPARFAWENQTAMSTTPDTEQKHSEQEQEQGQQQQNSFLDELECKATWSSLEQAVRHAGKESSLNEALTTQLLAAVRVTLALRRADLIRVAAEKRPRFAGGASSSEGCTEVAASASTAAPSTAATTDVATATDTAAASVFGVTPLAVGATEEVAGLRAEPATSQPLEADMVAHAAGDEVDAAGRTSAASSARPVEQSGSSAMLNQPIQMERRPAAASKSSAARLGSPGAREASPGPRAANATPGGHSCGLPGVRAPRNGRLIAATAGPAAKRRAQPKQRPSTSPRFGRVENRDIAPTVGLSLEQRSFGGAASVRKPLQRDDTPPPRPAGPPPEVCGEVVTLEADFHISGRVPGENGDSLQWLAPPLDSGEAQNAEWHDAELDMSEWLAQRSSGEPSRHGQRLRDAIPAAAASRLSAQSNWTGRGRGGRGRGRRARGGAQNKASRWH